MKKNIEITIDLTKENEEIWEQINEASDALKKIRKPWYKRLFSWF
jgi:hypothetical protein